MIDLSFLNELKKFSLIVNKRVTSKYIGQKKSIAQGSGMIFKDYRIYAPGDDFRNIDWKVYGRTDDLIVKTFEEERNMEVHIIMDVSKSMDFGAKRSKFDYAAMIGVGYAYLAMQDNSKFRFSTFSDTLETFQPRRGMHQIMLMVDHLNKLKMKGSSNLLDACTQYKNYISSRSTIVIISDFLFDAEEIKNALDLFGRHEVQVIQVLDKEEREIGVEGEYRLEDAETGETARTFVSNRMRLEMTDKLDHHIAEVKDSCVKRGYKFTQVTTSTPLFDAFYEILG